MPAIYCVFQSRENQWHVVYCYIGPILGVNGTNLFLVTLFLKILRVYRIFHNEFFKQLKWQYSNGFLIFCSIALSAAPNVYFITDTSVRYFKVTQECHSAKDEYLNILILVPYVYISFFALGNCILATSTAKIYDNFKDTKKVNFVMASIFIASVCISAILTFVPNQTGLNYRHISAYVYSYTIIVLCLFILVPKLSFILNIHR